METKINTIVLIVFHSEVCFLFINNCEGPVWAYSELHVFALCTMCQRYFEILVRDHVFVPEPQLKTKGDRAHGGSEEVRGAESVTSFKSCLKMQFLWESLPSINVLSTA